MTAVWGRAGHGSALMLTSAGHEQLEQLLKQVLALIERLHYDQVPGSSSSSSSSSSSRHAISKALRKFTGRREQQRHQNQHHHDNQQQQQLKKEKENTQQNNGKGLHPLAYTSFP